MEMVKKTVCRMDEECGEDVCNDRGASDIREHLQVVEDESRRRVNKMEIMEERQCNQKAQGWKVHNCWK